MFSDDASASESPGEGDGLTKEEEPTGRRKNASGGGAMRLLCGIAAFVAFVIAWVGTGPRVGMGINWDSAVYITLYSSGEFAWGHPPWNSHYAMGQVYFLVSAAFKWLGGTHIQGFRLANAACFSGAAAIFAFCALRLSRRMRLAALGVGVFVTAWGLLILVFTLEDNVLFLPAGLGVLAVCIARQQDWRARDATVAGAIAGAGALMSWQAVIYLFPPLWLSLVQGGAPGGRRWFVRVRDAMLVMLGLFAVLVNWVLFYWGTSRVLGRQTNLSGLFQILFSRPEPSFFPRGLSGWMGALGRPVELLRHLGVGVSHELGPLFRDSPGVQRAAPIAGALALGLVLMTTSLAIRAAWRRQRAVFPSADRLVFLCVVLTAFTVGTSFYLDLMVDKYKRYEYLPQLLVLIVLAVAGSEPRSWSRRMGFTVALSAWTAVQTVTAVLWNVDWHRTLPTLTPLNYHGHGRTSWYGYIWRIRHRNPHACTYVFAFEELAHARWQAEITAALHSELPAFVVVGDPASTAGWPRRLPVTDPTALRLDDCAWVSAAARERIAPKP
jgi:hypothetical protein